MSNIKTLAYKYINAVFIIYTIMILFRIIEISLIFNSHDLTKNILASELLGLLYDFLDISLILPIGFMYYFITHKIEHTFFSFVNNGFALIIIISYILIIKYFTYQLLPLDIFLYKYTIKEIVFTIKTSNQNFYILLLQLCFIITTIFFIKKKMTKLNIPQKTSKIVGVSIFFSITLFLLTHSFRQSSHDKFSMNKPLYFLSKTINHLNSNTENITLNASNFQQLYPHKTFYNKNYPLIHSIEANDELRKYFNNFETSPNIVLLIVEGLNDDFIHQYQGAVLMPFLNQLKDSSLYWNRCFTLGERSFAAVPSILGGLPYAENGFTLQEKLPRHSSLITTLSANSYYTSFYYGQGAWFHQKDQFFRYNDIDLIFDNSKFANDYHKIIVGEDHFFWGYNDKDLFNQSLKVIDTLQQKKRFDIYFTGTSHSPFIINDEELYNKKLEKLSTEPYNNFYQTYSTYLKSIIFTDDALKDFINNYKKRKEYNNTIFIITGDHPMTEIPPANSLKRYHVPLLIYSEKLKTNKVFKNIISHLDLSESILSFLKPNLTFSPSFSTSLGSSQIIQKESKNIAFMNDNREVIDFLSGDYYLSGNDLYFVDTSLHISKIQNDAIKTSLKTKLNTFEGTSLFVTKNNKILSHEQFCKQINHKKIYSQLNEDSISTSLEYFNITNKITIPNKEIILDISFNITSSIKKDIAIIYQISNLNDSTLTWQLLEVNDNGVVNAHLPINHSSIPDSSLFFQSYIWNKKNNKLTISDIDILLHIPIKKQ